MSQFAIDPEAQRPEPEVEGLVSAEASEIPHEPGLGEPLLDEDPLAGLNILEDDRFFVHETLSDENGVNPLAGARSQLGGLDSIKHEDVPAIETFDLDIEHPELHPHEPHGHDGGVHEHHAQLTETEEPKTEPERETREPEPEQIEEEPEEIPEPEPAPAPVARTQRKATPRKAPEPVVQELPDEPEEEEEEEPQD